MNMLDIRTIKRLADIEAAMTPQAITQVQLAQTCHMTQVTAGSYIRELLATKRIHIEVWVEASNRHKVAAYRWGAGRNRTKPRPRTKAEIQREWKKRLKTDPVAFELFLAKYRARDRADRARTKPQSWLSALGAL